MDGTLIVQQTGTAFGHAHVRRWGTYSPAEHRLTLEELAKAQGLDLVLGYREFEASDGHWTIIVYTD